MGAISKIFFNLSGGGPRFCTTAFDEVNKTNEFEVIPSIIRLALAEKTREINEGSFWVGGHLPIARFKSLRNTKPTRYWLSLDTTTGYPLCSVSFNRVSISSTVIVSWVMTDSVSFRL